MNITVGYHQTNRKTDTGKTLKRWPVFVDHYNEGMAQLQALSAKLDALDHQKGKYLTGSELKTMVWQITRSFASAVPVEEQRRQLVTAQGDANVPNTNIEQTSRHLDSLIHILEQLTVKQADTPQ